jgi:hypothetical protein
MAIVETAPKLGGGDACESRSPGNAKDMSARLLKKQVRRNIQLLLKQLTEMEVTEECESVESRY